MQQTPSRSMSARENGGGFADSPFCLGILM